MGQVKCSSGHRQAPLSQYRNISLDKTHCDFTCEFRLALQDQRFSCAAPPTQIGPRRSHQIKPGFIEKLAESYCAGATVFCVWIAVGLNRNDSLDERTHRCRATKLVWLTKISIQVPSGQGSETEHNQKRAC